MLFIFCLLSILSDGAPVTGSRSGSALFPIVNDGEAAVLFCFIFLLLAVNELWSTPLSWGAVRKDAA